MNYQVDITVDPPLTEIDKEDHDFVSIRATCSSRKSLEWFLQFVREREVVHFEIEECE